MKSGPSRGTPAEVAAGCCGIASCSIAHQTHYPIHPGPRRNGCFKEFGEMKKVEVPFLRKFGRTWHWQPSAAARNLGFVSVALGTDAAAAVEKAGKLWQQYQAKRITTAEPQHRGSFNHLKDVYYETRDWNRLEPETKRDYKRYIEKEICRHWGREQVTDVD